MMVDILPHLCPARPLNPLSATEAETRHQEMELELEIVIIDKHFPFDLVCPASTVGNYKDVAQSWPLILFASKVPLCTVTNCAQHHLLSIVCVPVDGHDENTFLYL